MRSSKREIIRETGLNTDQVRSERRGKNTAYIITLPQHEITIGSLETDGPFRMGIREHTGQRTLAVQWYNVKETMFFDLKYRIRLYGRPR